MQKKNYMWYSLIRISHNGSQIRGLTNFFEELLLLNFSLFFFAHAMNLILLLVIY